MSNQSGFVPLRVKNACLFEELDDSGIYRFVARQHADLNYISINKTAKAILDLCNGNSIDSIVDSIYNKYTDVDRERVQADVTNTLYLLWRLGVIVWENKKTPFFLDEADGEIVYSYMPENQLVSFYKSKNVVNSLFRSSDLDYGMETSEKFLRNSWYNYSRLYFSVQIKGLTNAVLCLSFNSFLQAFDVLFLDCVHGFVIKKEVLNGLMNFVHKCCNHALFPFNKSLGDNTAFYFYLFGDNSWFEEIRPEFCGELKKEFNENSVYIFKISSPFT